MGSSPSANLAYGFDLGCEDEFKVREIDSYGGLVVDWYDPDSRAGLVYQLFNHLYAAVPDPKPCTYDFQRQSVAEEHFGVKIAYSGSGDCPGYVLVVSGPGRSVQWSEVMLLDPAELGHAPDQGWDERLRVVLETLGLTPVQARPGWLVFPYYW